MATWVEDIVQALNNLGGRATRAELLAEIQRMRGDNLPKHWKDVVQGTIQNHSSDVSYATGKDLFCKIGPGEWALRDSSQVSKPSSRKAKSKHVSLPISRVDDHPIEKVASILRTIREYRDYQTPGSTDWAGYIKDMFNVLGFSTHTVNERLFTLSEIGAAHLPKVIVYYVYPGEDLDYFASGMRCDFLLLLAASFYGVNYGILTDGLRCHIYQINEKVMTGLHHWEDFDEIIKTEDLQKFLKISSFFSSLKNGKLDDSRSPSKKTVRQLNSRREDLQLRFWTRLLEQTKLRTKFFANSSPHTGYEYYASVGTRGIYYVYQIRKEDCLIVLYIDNGDREWNKQRYTYILEHKEEIESVIGAPLSWEFLPDKRASRIVYSVSQHGLEEEDFWEEMQDNMIEGLLKMDRALGSYLR